MTTEKKIFFNREDDVEVVVDRVINAKASRVILNIPKNSVLGKTVDVFHMIKRESETAGKEIAVESVDDHIVELAALASIKASNPIFRTRERAVSDILPRASFAKRDAGGEPPHDEAPAIHEERPESDAEREVAPIASPQTIFAPRNLEEPRKPAFSIPRMHFSPGGALIGIGGLVVVVAGVWGALSILPRADVVITLKKTEVPFTETAVMDSAVHETSSSSSVNTVIPGELLVARRNINLTFPASGKEIVETKAKGKLIVYNAFSSDPQTLVATTRFESPEKKIFRLDKRVTVPGAAIVDGKIVPSSIEVAVTADKAGTEYGVPASQGWHIPGFQGTPKYEGFTAEAKSPMTGGFIGERAVATTEDREEAQTKLRETLRGALETQMAVLLTNRFKLLEEATSFTMLEETVTPTPNDPTTFDMFGDAEMRHLVFEEETLKDALAKRALLSAESGLRVHDFTISYDTPRIDFNVGRMTVDVQGKLVFEQNIDPENLKGTLLGLDDKTLRATIFVLPGLERANIELWPFWVSSVPKNPKKVNVVLE